MRTFLCVAVVILLASSAIQADDQADLKALIDKAIKASGRDGKAGKLQAETFKAKGKFYGFGNGVDYTGEWAVQRPDKLRVKIETSAGDQKITSTVRFHFREDACFGAGPGLGRGGGNLPVV